MLADGIAKPFGLFIVLACSDDVNVDPISLAHRLDENRRVLIHAPSVSLAVYLGLNEVFLDAHSLDSLDGTASRDILRQPPPTCIAMGLPEPDGSFAGAPRSSPESTRAHRTVTHQIPDFFIADLAETGIIDRATPVNVHHTPIRPFRQ